MREDLPEGDGGQGVSAGERLAPGSPMLWLRYSPPTSEDVQKWWTTGQSGDTKMDQGLLSAL